MFSKDEEKEFKAKFWSDLNEELALVKGVHANKVNWTNFNTGIKNIYFRIDIEGDIPKICIDIQFLDAGIREIYYQQFEEFKERLNKSFKGEIKWLPTFEHSNTRTISRISVANPDLNTRNQDQWPEIYSFLIENFQVLESFWAEFNEVFKALK